MRRRGFLAALAALVAAPWLPKPVAPIEPIRGVDWGKMDFVRYARFYFLSERGIFVYPTHPFATPKGLKLLSEEARNRRLARGWR
jgi:hypothetical protein